MGRPPLNIAWYPSFLRLASVLLQDKSRLFVALASSCLSAGSFGAGLVLMRPGLRLLLGEPVSFSSGAVPAPQPDGHLRWLAELGEWVIGRLPGDPFWQFVAILSAGYCLALISGVGRCVHERAAMSVVLKGTASLRNQLFYKLLRAPAARALRQGTAEDINHIFSDVRVLSTGYEAVLSRTAGNVLRGGAALLVAFVVEWRLTLVALLCAPLATFLLRRFMSSISDATKNALQGYGRLMLVVQQALLGIGVVKIHQAEEHEQRRYEQVNRDVLCEEMSLNRTKALALPLLEAVMLTGFAAAAACAAWFVFRRDVEPASFITMLIALVWAAQSLGPLVNINHQLCEADAAACRLEQILSLETESGGKTKGCSLPRHCRDITFRGVTFLYPGRAQPALDAVDLNIPHGWLIAIVGANGSGKTTLVSLLPRIFEPARGHVLLDGVDIASAALESLREQMAVVPQENLLFQGTIVENIAYARPQATYQEVVDAARCAYAHDFIVQLPQGYRTQLGELGGGLSAGQKQRLAIARAILRNPSILILDEATSQIDSESEEKIQQVLRRLRGERTILAVTHCLKTMQEADQIVVLDRGRIVGQGRHGELLGRCSTYRHLATREPGPSRIGVFSEAR